MRTSKKMIVTLSLWISGVAFVALFLVKNPLISLSLLVIPPLLLSCCLAVASAGVLGGSLWLFGRRSKSKENDTRKSDGCC